MFCIYFSVNYFFAIPNVVLSLIIALLTLNSVLCENKIKSLEDRMLQAFILNDQIHNETKEAIHELTLRAEELEFKVDDLGEKQTSFDEYDFEE